MNSPSWSVNRTEKKFRTGQDRKLCRAEYLRPQSEKKVARMACDCSSGFHAKYFMKVRLSMLTLLTGVNNDLKRMAGHQ